MSRVVQPGCGGGKMRVRYTARRKRGLVAASKRMMAEGQTLRAAADELRVSAANLSKWVHNAMLEMKERGDIIRNAWKRHDYEWFLDDENSREQNVGTHDDGVEEGAV